MERPLSAESSSLRRAKARECCGARAQELACREPITTSSVLGVGVTTLALGELAKGP